MSLLASLSAPGARARSCATTGLNVCLDAQRFIKLNAVAVRGSIEAGLRMAEAAMGGLGSVAAVIDRTQEKWPFGVVVRSSQPVLACLASTQLLVEFTKAVTKRHRPDGALVVGGSMESTHAFPSGHVAFAAAAGAALTIALSRGRPESQGTGFLLTALLTVWVALSRIYLGRHWLTDTIGSVLLAAGMVSLCTIWLGPKTTGPPQGGPPRGAFSSVPPPPPE